MKERVELYLWYKNIFGKRSLIVSNDRNEEGISEREIKTNIKYIISSKPSVEWFQYINLTNRKRTNFPTMKCHFKFRFNANVSLDEFSIILIARIMNESNEFI